jgi:LacI family repressor for deo operon, udp, cdd, tsx, nupC, and nupG
MYQAAARHGYDVVVTTYERDKRRRERLCRDAIAQRMEGMILMGGLGGVPLQKLRDAGIAVLMVDSGPSLPPEVAALDVDIAEGVRLLTHHLLQLGHRRPMVMTHWTNDSRYLGGLREALIEAYFPPDDYMAVEGDGSSIVTKEAYNATRDAFRRDRRAATAILCNNDQQAIGAIAALNDLGLSVPGDVSVTGAGDISLAYYCRPALTTMSDSALRLGEHAVDMVISMLNGESPHDIRRVLRPEIVVRQSTGPVPSVMGDRDKGRLNQV